jgi:dipeptidyl aminopeptidase/acylaminoacyl peptidase
VVRRLALLATLVGVVGAAPAASSPSHTPASNGWIVFASSRAEDGALRLYRLEPIGGAVTPLRQIHGRQPAWSPDGSRIAYVDERYRLVVADADGTGARVLTSRERPAANPTWSPDGSRLAVKLFTLRRAAGDVVVMDADGSNARRLTRTFHDDAQPSWSPDGSLIVFASNLAPGSRVSDYELYRIRPDGRGRRQITRNDVDDLSPAWSPDGGLIAFQSGRKPGQFNPELSTMRSDGTDERRVQPAAGPTGFPSWSDTDPSWSPDGNWLVYVTSQTGYPENVFIVRPDGQGKIDLTPQTPSTDLDPAWKPVCSEPGTRGSDRLRGTTADDRVCGYAGDDSVSGGSGRDGLYGGVGNDSLRSVDRGFDVVGCGPGRDEVVADRVDLIGADCERVRRR